MKKAVAPAPTLQSAQSFVLAGLLPPQSCLALDVRSGIALLLNLSQPERGPLLRSCHVTPSAARVFLALLQAYPSCCSYERLFMALYSTEGQACSPVWTPAFGVRPVRRALFSLAPALRALGLDVVALRKRGYLLTFPSLEERTGEAVPVGVVSVP